MADDATTTCRRCGQRVSREAPRCPECGADPHTGASSFRSRGTDRARVCQGVGIRLVAQVIDAVLLLVVFIGCSYAGYLFLVAKGEFAIVGREPTSLPFWIAFVIAAFAYYWLCEGIWGRTLGKRLCDLRVVRTDGGHAGLWRALVRTILRTVDLLPAFYLLGALVIWLTRRDQRLGDLAAGTVVVRPRMVALDRLEGPTVVPWSAKPRA